MLDGKGFEFPLKKGVSLGAGEIGPQNFNSPAPVFCLRPVIDVTGTLCI